jgi:ribosomal protein S18 acetylase RimI-like enzyme
MSRSTATTGAEAADLALVRRLEEAALASWPTLTTLTDGAWLTRLAEGQTGRANSLNMLDHGDGADARRRLDAAVAAYRARNIPPLLRETPLTPPQAVALAEADGWRERTPCLVMSLDLGGLDLDLRAATPPESRASDYWLRTMASFMGFGDRRREAIGRKLARLEVKAGFFVTVDKLGTPVATAMAAIDRDVVALYEIGVAASERRRGHGERMVNEALGWAKARGARTAFLQVVEDNRGAVGLYRRLGFAERYRYRYLAPEGT